MCHNGLIERLREDGGVVTGKSSKITEKKFDNKGLLNDTW